MLKSRLSTLLLLIGVCATTNQAEARSLAEIKSSKVLLVGITGNTPPFQYKVANTNLGFEIDIAKAVAADLGVTVKFVELPTFPELLQGLATDQVDTIINTFALTSTKAASFDLTNPYACLSASLITADPTIKQPADLTNKKLGLIKKTIFLTYAQKLPEAKQIIQYDTFEEGLRDFVNKKFDATIGWKAMIPFLSKVNNMALQDTPVLWSVPVGMLVHNNNMALRLTINQSLAKMKRDGRFDKLDKTYFPTDSVVCKR